MEAICRDLAAEHAALDEIVASLSEVEWARPTPATGWTVQDQIGHLAYFDGTALLALTDPDRFSSSVEALLSGMSSNDGDPTLAEARGSNPVSSLRHGARAAQRCSMSLPSSIPSSVCRGTARR